MRQYLRRLCQVCIPVVLVLVLAGQAWAQVPDDIDFTEATCEMFPDDNYVELRPNFETMQLESWGCFSENGFYQAQFFFYDSDWNLIAQTDLAFIYLFSGDPAVSFEIIPEEVLDQDVIHIQVGVYDDEGQIILQQEEGFYLPLTTADCGRVFQLDNFRACHESCPAVTSPELDDSTYCCGHILPGGICVPEITRTAECGEWVEPARDNPVMCPDECYFSGGYDNRGRDIYCCGWADANGTCYGRNVSCMAINQDIACGTAGDRPTRCEAGYTTYCCSTQDACDQFIEYDLNPLLGEEEIRSVNLSAEYLDRLNPLQFSTEFEEPSTPGDFMSRFLSFLAFPLAGLILFLMLLWGGFEVLVQSPSKKNITAGRQRITAAIVGFIFCYLQPTG